jgi:hypothetical protein
MEFFAIFVTCSKNNIYMGLVTAKEVAKTINTDKYGLLGTFSGWLLMKVLKISTLNKVYDRNKHLKEVPFLNAILDEFQIKFEIPEEDFKRLPKEGPYITISNHPLGGIDGILLLKIMLEQEPDFKIIANFLLHRIDPMKPYIMPVNPFENHKDAKSSVVGIKETLRHLRDGKPLGMFPAGEVSTYKDGRLVVDKEWEEGAIKVIRKAQVPVVPIYFHAKNSLFPFENKRHLTNRKITIGIIDSKTPLDQSAYRETYFSCRTKRTRYHCRLFRVFKKKNIHVSQSFRKENAFFANAKFNSSQKSKKNCYCYKSG